MRMIETKRKPDMTPTEVAEELRLAYDTVMTLLKKGLIQSYRTGGPNRGSYRITREMLDAFKEQGTDHSS